MISGILHGGRRDEAGPEPVWELGKCSACAPVVAKGEARKNLKKDDDGDEACEDEDLPDRLHVNSIFRSPSKATGD